MKGRLIQKSWYRNFFQNKTFFKSNGKWYDYKDYQKGQKIEKIVGKYNTLIYCNCGNELTHSHSFIEGVSAKGHNFYLWKYRCSSCSEVQFWNPEIAGMAILKCDESGIPFIAAIM